MRVQFSKLDALLCASLVVYVTLSGSPPMMKRTATLRAPLFLLILRTAQLSGKPIDMSAHAELRGSCL